MTHCPVPEKVRLEMSVGMDIGILNSHHRGFHKLLI